MNHDLDRLGPWIGVGGLVVMLWLAISTVLYAPWWGVTLQIGLLLPWAFVLRAWAGPHPRRCLAVPALALVVWAGVNALGVTAADWSV